MQLGCCGPARHGSASAWHAARAAPAAAPPARSVASAGCRHKNGSRRGGTQRRARARLYRWIARSCCTAGADMATRASRAARAADCPSALSHATAASPSSVACRGQRFVGQHRVGAQARRARGGGRQWSPRQAARRGGAARSRARAARLDAAMGTPLTAVDTFIPPPPVPGCSGGLRCLVRFARATKEGRTTATPAAIPAPPPRCGAPAAGSTRVTRAHARPPTRAGSGAAAARLRGLARCARALGLAASDARLRRAARCATR
jgi:hypothetical protein